MIAGCCQSYATRTACCVMNQQETSFTVAQFVAAHKTIWRAALTPKFSEAPKNIRVKGCRPQYFSGVATIPFIPCSKSQRNGNCANSTITSAQGQPTSTREGLFLVFVLSLYLELSRPPAGLVFSLVSSNAGRSCAVV